MPQTPLTLRGRRGRWQTLSTYPYGECWVDSKASRVKCTTSSPLTPLHLRGVAKLTEADGAGNPSRLRSNRVAAWPLQVGGDPTLLVVRVQEVFPCTPATWRTRVWAAPTVLARPLGSRSRGKCAVGTHFKGFGVYKAQSQLCVALLGCLVIGGRMSAVSLKLPHAPCAPLSLDNLQVLVQSLPMAFG